jgi:dephospho-CoA kinase
MLVVGLTGGIGSGKSTATRLFAHLGVAITDTDAIAHLLTAPGQPALKSISSAFGAQCLTVDGTLDRTFLRRQVFSNPSAKKTLENILHPLIRQAVAAELGETVSAPYRIIVVPLLFETVGYADIVQRTLVIDCAEKLQIQRAMARNELAETEVRAIMATQLPRTERVALADDVIVNDEDLETLSEKVSTIHKKYLRLA